MPPAGIIAAFDEHLDDPGRRAGQGTGLTAEQAARVHGVEGVDVLVRGEAFDDERGIDVARQRKLDEDTVDAPIGVQARHDVEDLGCRDIPREPDGLFLDPDLSRAFRLGGDVRDRSRILSHQHNAQPRGHTQLAEGLDAQTQFTPDLG